MSRSITLTQLIRKINNCLPTRAIEIVVQLLYRVPISFHHDQTCFISAQLHDNDNLRGVLETIVQNPELNSTELYVVTKLIPQPQPLSPQPQLPYAQPLPYNNLDLNDPSFHTTTLTQDAFDIYTSCTQLFDI